MNKSTPDYAKIIMVGIPIGFIVWVLMMFLSAFLARFLNIMDYWFYLSVFLTLIVMSFYFYFCIRYSNKMGALIITDPALLMSSESDLICHFCSMKIVDSHSAKIWQQSITGKNQLYCLDCWNKKVQGSYKKYIIFSFFYILFGIFLVFIDPQNDFGWSILNLYLIVFWGIFMIFPHELGHVCAAKFLDMNILGVIVGFGKTVFAKKFWGVTWEFKSIPTMGLTLCLNLKTDKYRRREFFKTISGPLVHLFVIGLLLTIWPSQELFFGIFDKNIALISALFWANLIDLLGNLIPRRIKTDIGKISSDGLLLITVPFLSKEAIEQTVDRSKNIIRDMDKNIL
jgi:hypothetical protein